jgi:hypothetical protein
VIVLAILRSQGWLLGSSSTAPGIPLIGDFFWLKPLLDKYYADLHNHQCLLLFFTPCESAPLMG